MYLERLSWDRASRRCSDTLEFFSLACTPHGESCTQAGEGMTSDMILECKALVNQLIRVHGTPPEHAEFFLIKNEHDFGTYYEVGIFFTMTDPDGADRDDDTPSEIYARLCESGIPEKWDAEAIEELKEAGYTPFQPKEPARVVKHQGKVLPIKSETA